jgi:hypothetical protein
MTAGGHSSRATKPKGNGAPEGRASGLVNLRNPSEMGHLLHAGSHLPRASVGVRYRGLVARRVRGGGVGWRELR